MRERRGAVRCGVCAGLSGRGSRTWKISLFYLNRILNFNSESITRIIVCCMKFRKIEKSPNLWCSRQSSDHRLGWGWKPGIICLLGRDVLLVSVARAAPLATLSVRHIRNRKVLMPKNFYHCPTLCQRKDCESCLTVCLSLLSLTGSFLVLRIPYGSFGSLLSFT